MSRICGPTLLVLILFTMPDVSYCLLREFVLHTEKTSWNAAYLTCKQDGGQLLKLYSIEEDFALQKLLKNEATDDFWIGLNTDDENAQKESDFKFADCQPLFWSNWEDGFKQESDKQCVLAKKETRVWFREDCSRESHFICDIPKGDCTYERQLRHCPTESKDKTIKYGMSSFDKCKDLCETTIKNGMKCYGFHVSVICILHHSSDPYFCETSSGIVVKMYLRRCYSFQVSSHPVNVRYASTKPKARTCTTYEQSSTTSSTTSSPTTTVSTSLTTTIQNSTSQSTNSTTTTKPLTSNTESTNSTAETTTVQSTASNLTENITTSNTTNPSTTTTKPSISNTESTNSTEETDIQPTISSTENITTLNTTNSVSPSPTINSTNTTTSTAVAQPTTETDQFSTLLPSSTTASLTITTSTSIEAATGESTTVLESQTTTITTPQSQSIEHSTTDTTDATSPWSIRTTTKADVKSEVCICDVCGKRNMTAIEEKMKQVRNNLKVNNADLSATRRKKESAIDERPSAQSIGYIGIILFAVLFGSIFVSDLSKLYYDAKTLR